MKSHSAARRRPTFEQVAHPIALRQHGVVTRVQLLEAGLSRHVIDYRLQQGRLRLVHRGVYAVGPVLPPRSREMAACLACGPTAVVSHRSAAGLWGIATAPTSREPVEVSVRRGTRLHRGVVVHQSSNLARDERTRLDGVPVTTPARTLLDLAVAEPRRAVEQALGETLARRLATLDSVRRTLERHAGLPGTRRLRAVMDGGRPALTRSEAEERFLNLVRRGGVRAPEVNIRIAGYEVDFMWRTERVVVEVDGYPFHAHERAFTRDRLRDKVLAVRGYTVMRVTWSELVDEPLQLLVQLVQTLEVGRRRRAAE